LVKIVFVNNEIYYDQDKQTSNYVIELLSCQMGDAFRGGNLLCPFEAFGCDFIDPSENKDKWESNNK
jgi:hypothetical protein